jgi:hypothetical protein
VAELNKHEQSIKKAIEQFTATVTVPVLYDSPQGVDQVGTGTLLTLDGRYFLITAGHLFDGRDPGRFSIPKGRINADLHSLGPFQLWRAKEPEFDLAILELLEEFTLSYVKAGWRVLGLENIGPASPIAGDFVLCGYPSERARRTNDAIGGGLLTVFTQRLIDIPKEAEAPVHPALDLFFFHETQAPTLDGKIAQLPHLGGTSGASVWEYCEPERDALWVPERVLRAVGVQSSFRPGRYFRVKSWAAVLKMLRKADPALAPLVDAHTNREFGQIFD